jgi:hypothetical protein
MATWTTITDAALEPGKPIRSVDGLALRDNVTALAEGAAGAPRIAAAALQTGTTERDWVLARTSETTANNVGTYAFLRLKSQSETDYGANSTLSGSSLAYSNSSESNSGSLSGTWRCMGYSPSTRFTSDGSEDSRAATLWLRIA